MPDVAAPGMTWRALRDLYPPGSAACAYRAGDLVHESAVGDGGWLVAGVDAEPVEPPEPSAEAKPEPPAKLAGKSRN